MLSKITNFEAFSKDRKQMESDQRNKIRGKLRLKHLEEKTTVKAGTVSGSFKLKSQVNKEQRERY